ncbi:MAG TPA: hypothetical protein VKM54_12390 [Myxococcota bacterium]|nr:hypothetical protein [Myxococcota bacterium]
MGIRQLTAAKSREDDEEWRSCARAGALDAQPDDLREAQPAGVLRWDTLHFEAL